MFSSLTFHSCCNFLYIWCLEGIALCHSILNFRGLRLGSFKYVLFWLSKKGHTFLPHNRWGSLWRYKLSCSNLRLRPFPGLSSTTPSRSSNLTLDVGLAWNHQWLTKPAEFLMISDRWTWKSEIFSNFSRAVRSTNFRSNYFDTSSPIGHRW